MHPFTFFISYRRESGAPIALLLKYEIEKRLQFVRAFVDVEAVETGDSFPKRLASLIGKSHATIALINDKWMTAPVSGSPVHRQPKSRSPHAEPRHPDWVVWELEKSLTLPITYRNGSRHGLKNRAIIPLFVDCKPDFRQFKIPASIGKIATLHGEGIDYASWPKRIGPLIETIARRLKIRRRPNKDKYPPRDPVKASTQPIGDNELTRVLRYKDYDGWYVDNFGNVGVRYLVKTFKFPHFNEAAEFMKRVSDYCRALDHHPEWRNVFDHVKVALTTWDARRQVTIYDLNLALYMNKAAASVVRKDGGK
jgi:pterin-4a-carbinolamine dehydratase